MSPALTLRKETRGFSTRAVHVGSEPDEATNAVIQPISLSTTFKQDGVGNHKGYEYGRSGNPNRDSLERLLASLEAGGSEAIAFSSGSAGTATILQALGPNAHIVTVSDVYGGTFRYMTRVAKANQGLETTFLDLENATEEQIIGSIRENTKLIWIESPTNPTLKLVDIRKVATIAHSHASHPLVLVDNTFLSPYWSSPILQGADVVLHSLTKYINGHSDVIMGAAILPTQNTEFAQTLRFLQNAIGSVPSPHDCWLAQRGAKTLQLRMKTHGLNALAVARTLEKSPYVKEVIYPGLKSHHKHELARSSLSPHAMKFVDSLDKGELNGDIPFGGMVSFRIHGDESTAERFLTKTKLFTLAESLGGVESLAELPSKMTHASIPPAERAKLGIDNYLIRLSVGIEDGEDLVKDIEEALEESVDLADIALPIKQAQHNQVIEGLAAALSA